MSNILTILQYPLGVLPEREVDDEMVPMNQSVEGIGAAPCSGNIIQSAQERFLLAEQMRTITNSRAEQEELRHRTNTQRRTSSVQAVLQHLDVHEEERDGSEEDGEGPAPEAGVDALQERRSRKLEALQRLQRLRLQTSKSPQATKTPKAVQKMRRSNRMLIKNALQFVCLAGNRLLNYIILFKIEIIPKLYCIQAVLPMWSVLPVWRV